MSPLSSSARACPRFHHSGWLALLQPHFNLLNYKLWSVLLECACSRNTKILTHCRLWLWRWWEKFLWPWFLNRSMAGLNVCGTVCEQKVVILSIDHWNVFFKEFLSFLKILYRYLLYSHLNKCLKYGQNLWLY